MDVRKRSIEEQPAEQFSKSDDMEKADGHGHAHDRVFMKGLRLVFCSGAILVCYFYFGVIQEKITKSRYGTGEEEEGFHYTQALVFFQCFFNGIVGGVLLKFQPASEDVPSWLYALCAFSYLVAMVASNHALQFIPYPVQVLGKSIKPIPIMIFGMFFAHKRYQLQKYLFVLIIVIGVATFLYKDDAASKNKNLEGNTWGYLLLLLSLSMDGVTGAVQDRIRAFHTFHSHQMMFNMNLYSTFYLLMALVVTGEIFNFVDFVQKYPYVLGDMVTLSVASALGQFFIFKTVAEFGPLTCSIVTTTRKFFTILISVIYFAHPLSNRQWMGTSLVFTGLALDAIFATKKKR